MKKKLALFMCAVLLLSCISLPAFATTPSVNPSYTKSSFSIPEIKETHYANGITEFTVTEKKLVSQARTTGAPEYQLTQQVAVAMDEETAELIRKGIERAQTTTTTSDWYLGSSLYMEVSLKYSTITKNSADLYRIESIKATTSVNSGTTITDLKLNYACIGSDSNGSSVYNSNQIDIKGKANPYTTTVMSSYPYIYYSGAGLLGAGLECTAARPSGTSYTYTLSNNIFAG